MLKKVLSLKVLLKKNFYTILFIITLISLCLVIILPQIILGLGNYIYSNTLSSKDSNTLSSKDIRGNYVYYNTLVKEILFYLASVLYENISPIYYSGNYIKSNKVDIVMCNHYIWGDAISCVSVIKKFDNRNIYSLYSNHLLLAPCIGLLTFDSNDINLTKNIKYDEGNIIKSLDKIDSGIILIFPEGHIYTNSQYSKSVKYSRQYNLPVLKSLLLPRTKGMFLIYNYLMKNNKMGNIIDMTGMNSNFNIKKSYNRVYAVKNMMFSNYNDTYYHIRTYNNLYQISNYDNFKEWLINIWVEKDKILDIMPTNNLIKTQHCQGLQYKIIIVVNICIVLLLYTNVKYYFYIMLLLSSLIGIYRYIFA